MTVSLDFPASPVALVLLTISGAPDVGRITCLENISVLTTSFYLTFQVFGPDRPHLPIRCPRRVTLVGLISPSHLTAHECQSLPVSMFLGWTVGPLEGVGKGFGEKFLKTHAMSIQPFHETARVWRKGMLACGPCEHSSGKGGSGYIPI